MSIEPPRRKQHLVSNGYQKNFSDGGFVTVIDVAELLVLEHRRPTKKNWRLDDFLSVEQAETIDDSLEKEIARIEKSALNLVRDIQPNADMPSEQRESLDQLTAMHLLRSRAFADIRRAVATQWLGTATNEMLTHPELEARFELSRNRRAEPGELEILVDEAARSVALGPEALARAVRNGLPTIQTLLAGFNVQLISLPDHLPGFILADHPILHGRRAEGVFGFERAGAVGDADTILVPVKRRLTACYTRRQMRSFEIRTKNALDWINALLAQGATREVLCHPEDALPAMRLLRNLDRFPATSFDQTPLR